MQAIMAPNFMEICSAKEVSINILGQILAGVNFLKLLEKNFPTDVQINFIKSSWIHHVLSLFKLCL